MGNGMRDCFYSLWQRSLVSSCFLVVYMLRWVSVLGDWNHGSRDQKFQRLSFTKEKNKKCLFLVIFFHTGCHTD